MAGNNGQHDFIEFVCKPVEDLYLSFAERSCVRIEKGTEYRCSMLRDQHFSSLFRHYGKHNGVNKDSLVFFFTEELMQELDGSDTPRSVHLRKNDVIVIRHRHKPEPDDLLVRLDMNTDDALDLIQAYPRARSLQSSDGRTALHHLAARGGAAEVANRLLVLGCDPTTVSNYGQLPHHIATEFNHHELAAVLQPHEFKRQMAVIRAHFVRPRKIDEADSQHMSQKFGHDIILKRACTSKNISPEGEVKQNAAVRFLFSALAHGNQARNFKRVVDFLYA